MTSAVQKQTLKQVHFYIEHLKEVQKSRPKAIMNVYYKRLISKKYTEGTKRELLRRMKIQALLTNFCEELL